MPRNPVLRVEDLCISLCVSVKICNEITTCKEKKDKTVEND